MKYLFTLEQWQIFKSHTFCFNSQEYLTINNQGFNIFYLDGRYKDRIEPEEHVDKLLYARSAKRYVGWIDDEEYLKVSNVSFYYLPYCRGIR